MRFDGSMTVQIDTTSGPPLSPTFLLTPAGLPAFDPRNYGLNIDFRARGLGNAVPAGLGVVLHLACVCAVAFALVPVVCGCSLKAGGRETARQLVRNAFPATLLAFIFIIAAAVAYIEGVVTPLNSSSNAKAVALTCKACGDCCGCYFSDTGPTLQVMGTLSVLLLGVPALALVVCSGRGWMFAPRPVPAAGVVVSPLSVDVSGVTPPPGVALQQPAAERAAAVAQQGGPLCIICIDKPATHICIPCGHLCACGSCLQRLQACPLCRSHIAGVVKVFLA